MSNVAPLNTSPSFWYTGPYDLDVPTAETPKNANWLFKRLPSHSDCINASVDTTVVTVPAVVAVNVNNVPVSPPPVVPVVVASSAASSVTPQDNPAS